MILVPHNPGWSEEFAALREVYLETLGGLVLRVEHVGSTSVPGLLAKPILDIDLVMPDYGVFPQIVAGLGKLGYTHNGDQGIKEREAFKPRDERVPDRVPPRAWMTHHLYVCPAHGVELHRHLVFRDALRTQAKVREEYERLKLAVAVRAGEDRRLYAQIKEGACRNFVERVLAEFQRHDESSA